MFSNIIAHQVNSFKCKWDITNSIINIIHNPDHISTCQVNTNTIIIIKLGYFKVIKYYQFYIIHYSQEHLNRLIRIINKIKDNNIINNKLMLISS